MVNAPSTPPALSPLSLPPTRYDYDDFHRLRTGGFSLDDGPDCLSDSAGASLEGEGSARSVPVPFFNGNEDEVCAPLTPVLTSCSPRRHPDRPSREYPTPMWLPQHALEASVTDSTGSYGYASIIGTPHDCVVWDFDEAEEADFRRRSLKRRSASVASNSTTNAPNAAATIHIPIPVFLGACLDTLCAWLGLDALISACFWALSLVAAAIHFTAPKFVPALFRCRAAVRILPRKLRISLWTAYLVSLHRQWDSRWALSHTSTAKTQAARTPHQFVDGLSAAPFFGAHGTVGLPPTIQPRFATVAAVASATLFPPFGCPATGDGSSSCDVILQAMLADGTPAQTCVRTLAQKHTANSAVAALFALTEYILDQM